MTPLPYQVRVLRMRNQNWLVGIRCRWSLCNLQRGLDDVGNRLAQIEPVPGLLSLGTQTVSKVQNNSLQIQQLLWKSGEVARGTLGLCPALPVPLRLTNERSQSILARRHADGNA